MTAVRRGWNRAEEANRGRHVRGPETARAFGVRQANRGSPWELKPWRGGSLRRPQPHIGRIRWLDVDRNVSIGTESQSVEL